MVHTQVIRIITRQPISTGLPLSSTYRRPEQPWDTSIQRWQIKTDELLLAKQKYITYKEYNKRTHARTHPPPTKHTHKTKDRVTQSIPLAQIIHDVSLSWLSTAYICCSYFLFEFYCFCYIFMCNRSLVLCVVFCRFLFVHLPFLFWTLYCLSFLDIRLLTTPFGNFVLL